MKNLVKVAFLLDCLLMFATRTISSNDWECGFLENVENDAVSLDATTLLLSRGRTDAQQRSI